MTLGESRNNGEKMERRVPPVEHQFKPGNPGRPKGSRNKLGEAFIADLYETWKRRGIEAIERTIDEHPEQYLKVIAMLMPKDMNVNVRPLDHMSDEQLLRRLRQVTELARPLLLAGRVIEIDPVTVSND
jgi:hypothetical protein